MPDYRSSSDVKQALGSSRMILIEHDASYVLTGAPYTLPVLKDSNASNSVATLSDEDEEGVTYQEDGAKTLTKTVTVMQKDKDALRLPRTLSGKTFAWVKEMSRTADSNGDFVYEYGVGAKVSANFEIGGKTNDYELTLNITPNDGDVTFALASFDDAIFKGNLGSASSETLTDGYGFDYTAVSPA